MTETKGAGRVKKAAVLLTIAYILLTLTSCSFITFGGGEETQAAETVPPSVIPDGLERVEYDPAPSVAEAQKRVASLGGHEFAKDSFSAAVTPDFSFAPDRPEDGYDAALVTRNGIVEKRYGVTLGEFETPLELMLSDSYSAYLAGLYYADVMIIPQSAVGAFAEKGYLLNVYSLPYLNYEKEWFTPSDMDQAAAGTGAYAVTGTLTDDPGSYYCVYVNDALAEKLGVFVPYDSVKDGSWTWDRLIDCARSAATPDAGVRILGAGTHDELVCAVCKSAGGYFLNTGLGRTPSVGFDNASTQKAVDVLRSLKRDDQLIFAGYTNTGDAFGDFKDGRVLFYADTVANMEKVCAMGGDWRVMPIPKLDAAQEDYVACLSPSAPVLVTDAGNPYPEDTAYALDALFAATGEYVRAAYSERLIRTSVNCSATLEMLDYVCGVKAGSAVYDFCDMFGASYPVLKTAVQGRLWELICGDGTVADAARSASSDLSWPMSHAFPEVKR